jgi:hypothetical protein
VASDPASATTGPSPKSMSSTSSASPCPLGRWVFAPRLCCLGSRGGEGGVAAEWSCAPVPPIRSLFQSGMRCSTVLITVLASMPARAAPRQKCTRGRRRHGGPSERRRDPCERSVRRSGNASSWTSIGPAGDRADDVEGAPRLQPASPVLLADASPCSTVLPEMVRLPPVAWVISTRRG